MSGGRRGEGSGTRSNAPLRLEVRGRARNVPGGPGLGRPLQRVIDVDWVKEVLVDLLTGEIPNFRAQALSGAMPDGCLWGSEA